MMRWRKLLYFIVFITAIFAVKDVKAETKTWNGSLFEEPSTKYNNDLAMVSAEFCEKALGHSDKNIKALLESSDYNLGDIRTYHYNAVPVARELVGGAAFVIAQDTLEIHGEETDVLVIVARGSTTLGEFIGDVAKGPAFWKKKKFLGKHKVYQHIEEFEGKILKELKKYVEKHGLKNRKLKILITGYSLGGAAANMLAARLDDKINQGQAKNKLLFAKVKKEDIYVYTFGAIKVLTTEKNVSKGYENIHNIYNYYDSFGPNGVNAYIGASSINAKFGHTILYKSKHPEKAINIKMDDLQDSVIIGGIVALHRTKKELKRALIECTNHAIGSYKQDLKNRLVYDAAEELNLIFEDEDETEFGNLSVGDSVYFGHYEQDGNTKNGKEKIEWQVLDKKKGKALLISKKILDIQPYNKEWEYITWEKCTLRTWLNKDFIKEAFTSKESKKIQKSKIENKDNKEYGTKGGKNTTDKIFLLSIDEAKKYYKTDEKRTAELTNYVIKRLAKGYGMSEKDVKAEYFSENKNWWYWLRSPGDDQLYAAFVYFDGSVYEFGNRVNNGHGGVRPAIWVGL